MKIINEYKENSAIQSKEARKKSKKLIEKGQEITSKFNLSRAEKENIFNILEEEF